jgi:protein-L-isoaspartate(D-aspartate) O-methyltransferase
MIEALAGGRNLGKTLEVGTGCGYQAAVLSHLATDVYTIERIAPLLERAKRNLRQLRLPNVRLKHADGNLGLPEAAPFDTIIVAAAAPLIPPALLAQLAPSGRLMMPVGRPGDQQLVMVERRANGLSETRLDLVRFVPLIAGVE